MALDHFISQTYLRKFALPQLSGHLFAVRKTDLFEFTPRTQDVCRIEEGNTNPFLNEPRAIEEFLRVTEPRFNEAVKKIEDAKIDRDALSVVAGLAFYFALCSPTAARLGSSTLRAMVKEEAKILDKKGEIPPPPEALKAKSITELIDKGELLVDIDQKYPQGLGIQNIIRTSRILGNSHWELIRNDLAYSPFLTSDYPIVLVEGSFPGVMDKIFPLTPSIAIRFHLDPRTKALRDEALEFPNFSYSETKCSYERVRKINSKIAKCAESLIFANHKKAG